MKNQKYRLLTALLLIFTMVSAVALSACGTDPVETSEVPHNAITGETEEDGYDTAASDKRVAAFVVENAPDARPQWGLDDENYSPDMVVQGEVEGGITRTLWLYADYTKLPAQIGPTRSARPPFVKFSELFDSIFIHWGMSHSSDNYVGASTIFNRDHVDHINQMTYGGDVELFGRDSSRGVSAEHTGVIYGDKVEEAIKEEGFREEPEDYTKLYFNDTAQPVSDKSAVNVNVTYSERAFESTAWVYNEEDGKYHSSSFENDFVRDNLLVLYDDTEYITKENYQGPGSAGSVTYCDYKFTGGKAELYSQGTVKEIEWMVEDGKLILKDPDVDVETANTANEEAFEAAKENKEETYTKPYIVISPEGEDEEEAAANSYVVQPLNKGKTWVGWISKNNGGSVSVS